MHEPPVDSPTYSAREALLVVGLSHHTAPIDVRERFVLGRDVQARWVRSLVAVPGVSECLVLSTCNRTECYLSGPDPDRLERLARDLMCEASGLGRDGDAYLTTARGLEAARHLFRVVSGLDSLIIGEPQIQGQVRSAYRAPDGQLVGPVLHRLFQSALAAGGRVREMTSIGRGATSIPSAAVSLARKVFGSLEDRTVLVVGTGEMGRLTVECLRSVGVRRVYVASRNPARAERVGLALDAIPIDRAAALERIADMDVMITCTESEAAFVAREQVAGRGTERAPLVILDIAVPRNVDPRVADLRDVFLYNIDDLQRVVDQTREARAFEGEGAEAIISRHAGKYWAWHRSRVAAPAIRALRETSRALVEDALAAARPPGPRDADADERALLACRAALNKILHGPTRAIRWLAERSDGEACLSSLEPLLVRPSTESWSRGIAGGGLG